MLPEGARAREGDFSYQNQEAFPAPEPALEGKVIGTICMTEPDAGSDLLAIATRAERRGGDRQHHDQRQGEEEGGPRLGVRVTAARSVVVSGVVVLLIGRGPGVLGDEHDHQREHDGAGDQQGRLDQG